MDARIHKPTNTVVCLASNTKNLHSKYGEQLGLSDDYEFWPDVPDSLRCGDLCEPVADEQGNITYKVTHKPENYPKPAPPTREEKIEAEARRIALAEAEQSLIDKSEIQPKS